MLGSLVSHFNILSMSVASLLYAISLSTSHSSAWDHAVDLHTGCEPQLPPFNKTNGNAKTYNLLQQADIADMIICLAKVEETGQISHSVD